MSSRQVGAAWGLAISCSFVAFVMSLLGLAVVGLLGGAPGSYLLGAGIGLVSAGVLTVGLAREARASGMARRNVLRDSIRLLAGLVRELLGL